MGAVLSDDPLSEKTVRASLKRIRKGAEHLRDRLQRSSEKIVTLDEAVTHPDRAVADKSSENE
jgi:hypothetical protein